MPPVWLIIGAVALVVLAFLVWVGADVVRAMRPPSFTAHHPFRSPAAQARYLAHYEARSAHWPWPVALETRSVETAWGSTFMRISGPSEGPPLVLLPGANTTSLSWNPVIEALARDHRLYALDNIHDFGRSINSRPFTTGEDFAAWLDELFDVLELGDSVRVMGLSYGGWIASQYALAHPERVESLVLLAPAATFAEYSPAFLPRALLVMIPVKATLRSLIRFTLSDLVRFGDPDQHRLLDEAVDDIWTGMRTFEPRPVVMPVKMSDEQLTALPRTLVLIGEHEVIYDRPGTEIFAELERKAPAIETELLTGVGHSMHILAPDRVVDRVLPFLDSANSAG